MQKTPYIFNVPLAIARRKFSKTGMAESRTGNCVIEFTLMIPWFLFLFVGALDMGFYGYALTTTASAARVAALYTSVSASQSTDTTTACFYAVEELRGNINMTGISTCGGSSPVALSATQAATGPDNALVAKLTVSFTTPVLIPIPGVLNRQFVITQTVWMKPRG